MISFIPHIGILQKRYKRFLADVQLDNGNLVTAHCPNSGAMLGITSPGSRVVLSYNPSPTRKLPYTWQAINVDDNWIGMNTMNPNILVRQALQQGQIKELQRFGNNIRPEVKYGNNSRVDFLLTNEEKICFLEVKNVHLVRQDSLAEFPDCVTDRGAKHMAELSSQLLIGNECVVLYIVQRSDVDSFKIAGDLDPKYYHAATLAKKNGLQTLAYNCKITVKADICTIAINQPLIIQ